MPVPIEEIIELKLNIEIIPIEGMFQVYEVDAYITSDTTAIYVDQYMFMNRLNRCRFSLAHEMGHAVLHQKCFQQLGAYDTTAEWKQVQTRIDDSSHRRLESQANTFASFLLMPEDDVQKRFPMVKEKVGAKSEGMDDVRTSVMRSIVIGVMAQEFLVSEDAMRIRLEKANLL